MPPDAPHEFNTRFAIGASVCYFLLSTSLWMWGRWIFREGIRKFGKQIVNDSTSEESSEAVRNVESPTVAIESGNDSRAAWSGFGEGLLVVLTLLFVVTSIHSRFAANFDRQKAIPTTNDLLMQLVASLGIVGLYAAVLLLSNCPLSAYGFRLHPFRRQVLDGVKGYLFCLIPMALAMILTLPLRTQEGQHALLRMMNTTATSLDLLLICILATVIAPLSEELMFRVVLQGWLTAQIGPLTAGTIVAIAFSMIHGLTDGLALIPLSAILGTVFHRKQSYLSVVVIHLLFNATMLVLQFLFVSLES